MGTVTKPETAKQPAVTESGVRRIDRKYLTDSVLSAFYLEKGLLFTLRMLLLKPGKAVYEFLFTERRSLYTRPLGFLILSSSIAAIIAFSFSDGQELFMEGFNEGVGIGEEINATEDDSPAEIEGDTEEAIRNKEDKEKVARQTGVILNYYSQNFNLFLILFVPFSAFFCHLFFKKDRWYYTEHLVSNAYMASMQNVISLPFFLLAFLSPWITGAYIIFGIIYQIYFFNRVYEGGKGVAGIFRIFAVLTLSSLSYMLFLIMLMLIVFVVAII